TTYRYNFTGSFPTNGDYAIVFQGGSFSDTALHTNVAVTKHFTATTPPVGDPVGPNGPVRGPPVARLTNPADGSVLDPAMLNSRRFLDVTFESRDGDPLDLTTINGDELSISGTAVLDPELKAGAPVRLAKNTYRYFLEDKNLLNDPVLGNTVPMFGPGILTITFVGNKFASGTDGQALFNLEKIETLTLTAGTAATTQTTLNLGPLSLVNPKVSVEDIGFADGKLSVSIGIALDSASLKFGGTGTTPNPSGNQTSSGITAVLTGIFATFDLGVGLPGNFSVSATGKFSLNI